MYEYYGYKRIGGSRAAETRSLGSDLVPIGRPSVLHPFMETGVGGWHYGDSAVVATGGVPIWGGLSDKEKALVGAAVALGLGLWLFRSTKFVRSVFGNFGGRKNPAEFRLAHIPAARLRRLRAGARKFLKKHATFLSQREKSREREYIRAISKELRRRGLKENCCL